jgi:NAD(P)-dependent dehydrogenase (short-subunit alcohol dehydrogenase family)
MARLALVTGTSTGIGRAIAIYLARRGFQVLAGVRKPGDAPPGLEPIMLDVTSEDDIAAAAGRVGRSLHALVNNAGIWNSAAPTCRSDIWTILTTGLA